jgi:hypothetical protein
MSLWELCDDLGLPATRRLDRTMEDARAEIQAFYNEHGKRPSYRKKAALAVWLRKQDTSLGDLCDELGLPGKHVCVRGRTMGDVRAEIQAFYDEHGTRPTCARMVAISRWLHKRQLSLGEVCDEMGLK